MGSAPARPGSPGLSRLVVCRASREDARDLAPFLRHEDAAEIDAATGQSPLEALLMGLGASPGARSVHEVGRPIAMFGLVPGRSYDVPWLLGSDRILAHWREFARRSREELDRLRQGRPLRNYVDARNTVHVRWLRWLGAEILPAAPWGLRQLPFHLFTL